MGVVFKTTDLTKTVDTNPMRFSPASTSVDYQEQDMQQLYNRMVSENASAI